MVLLFRCLSILILSHVLFATSHFGQNATTLEAEKPVERELKGGDAHRFTLLLAEEEFFHVVADQRGVDIVLSLFAPDGTKLLEIDSPNGNKGPEAFWTIGKDAGNYTVEIRSPEPADEPGIYEVRVDDIQSATPDLRSFSKAQDLMRESTMIMSGKAPNKVGLAKAKILNAAELIDQIQYDKQKKAAGLVQVGKAFAQLKMNDEALRYDDRAAAIYEELGLKREQMMVLVESQEQALTELDLISRNEKVRKLAIELGDRKTEASALIQIGTGYYDLGDFSHSIMVVQQALQIGIETGDKARMDAAYDNLGAFYTAQGNFAAALESHQKALAIQYTIRNKQPKATTILNIGNVYEGLGNYELAIESFQKAQAMFEKMKAAKGTAYAISNIGSVYLDMGNYEKALEYFLRAQPLKAKFLPDDPTSFYNIAAVYRGTGRYKEALEYLNQAMALCEKIGNTDCKAITHIELSNTYTALNEFLKAREHAGDAISLSLKNKYDTRLWSAYLSAANAELGLGKKNEARIALEASIGVVDALRANITGGEQGGERFFDQRSEPFQKMVGLSLESGNPDIAFSYAEQMKARTILDVLQSGKIDVHKAMTSDERSTERALKNELASYNSQMSDESDASRQTALQNQIDKKRLELEEFRLKLYGAHPELRIQRGELKPAGPKEAARQLSGSGSALLEYVVADSRSYLFVITKDANDRVRLKGYPIDVKQKDLAAKVESYRSMIAGGDLDFQRQSRELYDLLLKPAHSQLEGKTNLIVVPDGALWNLPFQSLSNEKNQYLIQQAAISYAPSVTALKEMSATGKKRQLEAKAELLAFGDPIVSDSVTDRIKQVYMGEKLGPLKESGRLVNELGKIYGQDRSEIFVGTQASEETAKSEAPKYRIIQFATHGILNDASPMYSHLVLAQDVKNSTEDGLLEAWEMKDLDLKADMVILSACDTARGRISNGEGVIGMSWALFIAGTPTTVASQWKVESSSTTELMLEFHRQLLTGKVSKAEALRRAELKLLRSKLYSHPSYWAPFVIVGDGS